MKSGSGALDGPPASEPAVQRFSGAAVSDYGFGVEDGIEQGEPQAPANAAPKWFRERMDEVSETLKELRAENDRLKEGQRRTQVAEALTAQGYAPQAAGLYTGKPEGLTDWLSANGAALAKVDGGAVEQGQGTQGVPATVVSPESQAAQQAFSAAGSGAASGLSGDEQLAARIAGAQNDDEVNAILKEQGSRFF